MRRTDRTTPLTLCYIVFPNEPLNSSDSMLRLDVRFVRGPAAPDCRVKQCGADGRRAGRMRSVSRTGQYCVDEQFVCRAASHCQPDCTSRQCGDDGCGGQCGQCSGRLGLQQRRTVPRLTTKYATGRQPTCSHQCGVDQYCASVSHEQTPHNTGQGTALQPAAPYH